MTKLIILTRNYTIYPSYIVYNYNEESSLDSKLIDVGLFRSADTDSEILKYVEENNVRYYILLKGYVLSQKLKKEFISRGITEKIKIVEK